MCPLDVVPFLMCTVWCRVLSPCNQFLDVYLFVLRTPSTKFALGMYLSLSSTLLLLFMCVPFCFVYTVKLLFAVYLFVSCTLLFRCIPYCVLYPFREITFLVCTFPCRVTFFGYVLFYVINFWVCTFLCRVPFQSEYFSGV